jgi:hypothetical protein
MDKLMTLKASISREDLKSNKVSIHHDVLGTSPERPCVKVVFEILHRQLIEEVIKNGVTQGGGILPVQLGQPAAGKRDGAGAGDT